LHSGHRFGATQGDLEKEVQAYDGGVECDGRSAFIHQMQLCWRQFKIDHLCQLNFDQGSKAGILLPGCG